MAMPKILKWTLRGLGFVLLALVLFVLAWVAFNNPLADSKPQPRPAQLLEKYRDLPAASNGFFTQIGLLSSAGEDPAVAGRGFWAKHQYAATQGALPLPRDTVWACDRLTPDCTSQWLQQGDTLARELQSSAEFFRRCTALADSADYEELTLPMTGAAMPELPRLAPVNLCNKMLRATAVLAAEKGDRVDVVQALTRADHLARLQLAGSHTLIGHAVAWSVARNTWRSAASLAQRHPELAPALVRIAQPLTPAARTAQRWMAYESTFNQSTVHWMASACELPVKEPRGLGDKLWCNFKIGMLPNATAQAFDQRWSEILAAGELGMPALLNAPVFTQAKAASIWSYVHWRNTMGGVLFAVGRAQYLDYLARQADVEMQRQATELALRMAAEHVAAGQREDWLKAQPLPDFVRARLSFDGNVLVAKPWMADVQTGELDARYQIRVPLAS